MTAFNVVRMKVKPGHEADYINFHANRDLSDFKGMKALHIIRTGEREYLFIGQWTGMDALAAARDAMVKTLDQFRDTLEDLGGDLGVTDPRSGEAVISRTL
jgi:heme-degrading monooxygenase HmoA